ncbi:hypothetical protein VA7868_02117 [Vibrio aerogenes CECT 7868]|uniref:Tc1-like transposase DDE domain-containing protein n=1 Tax=Vibrio aerogenes CECT 7868 TaxID=1216006 RepID=A0A1M5YYZ4_9VIBR|nr:hypothetical protein VA7868_02117 [Vibrio aerogenes CECT 7868]
MVVPWVNKDIMIEHLRQISAITEKGRYSVVVMDGAGWHTEDIACEFENVSIMKLPPYSPELNPIEQTKKGTKNRHKKAPAFQQGLTIQSK